MTDTFELTLDAAIAPTRILGCHPHDQRGDLLHQSGTDDPFSVVRPLQSDQAPMPAHDRVWRHDGRDTFGSASSDALALRREPMTLIIVEPQLPVAHLLLQDSVFFDEVRDDVLLMSAYPAANGQEEQL